MSVVGKPWLSNTEHTVSGREGGGREGEREEGGREERREGGKEGVPIKAVERADTVACKSIVTTLQSICLN